MDYRTRFYAGEVLSLFAKELIRATESNGIEYEYPSKLTINTIQEALAATIKRLEDVDFSM